MNSLPGQELLSHIAYLSPPGDQPGWRKEQPDQQKKTGLKQIKCIRSSEQLWPLLPILCSGNNAQSPSRRSEHRSHESKSRWKLRPCLPHQWQGYKLSSDPRGTLFPVTENNVQTSAKTKCTILPLNTFVYSLWHLKKLSFEIKQLYRMSVGARIFLFFPYFWFTAFVIELIMDQIIIWFFCLYFFVQPRMGASNWTISPRARPDILLEKYRAFNEF